MASNNLAVVKILIIYNYKTMKKFQLNLKKYKKFEQLVTNTKTFM